MKFFFDDERFSIRRRALYLLLHTNWLRYFRKNGRRCWKGRRAEAGWKTNSLSSITWRRGDSAGVMYQARLL